MHRSRFAFVFVAMCAAMACSPDTPQDDVPDAAVDDTPDTSVETDAGPGPDPDMDSEPDASETDMGQDTSRDPLTGAWSEGFGFAGVEGGPGSGTKAVVEDADGSFVFAGDFDAISGVVASNVARWDGSSWSAMGDGLPITVSALVRDADSGAFYAAGENFGDFGVSNGSNAIWTWDGSAWSQLAEIDGDFTRVHTLHLAEDGALWVGGSFEGVEGTGKPNLARLDRVAETWSAPAQTPDGPVRAIERVGDALCVAGSFWGIGADLTELGGVACLENDAWSKRGAGLPGEVYDLLVDGPTGEVLAAGSFVFTTDPSTGEFEAGLARWDGAAWTSWGGGVDGGRINIVRGLARMPDDSILAWGSFASVKQSDGTSLAASHIAKIDDQGTWTAYGEGVRDFTAVLAPGVEGLYDVAVTADGRLFAAGLFLRAGETISRGVSAFTERAWRALAGDDYTSSGVAMGFVSAFAEDEDGETLYVGGTFRLAGDQAAVGVAALDVATRTWSTIGLGLDGWVQALAREPGTDRLWASGEFTLADGTNAQLAIFEGGTWKAAEGAEFDGPVSALAWHDGTLYVAGAFTSRAGSSAMRVAAWDGSSWSSLGDGVGVADDGGARALAIDDEGGLIVGGGFEVLGSGGEAKGLARWDGQAWSELGGGLSDDLYVEVNDVKVHRGEVWVGGAFARAGDATVNSVARWDGSTWHGFDGGFASFDLRDHVFALLPYGDGVFATGTFRGEDGALNHIAWWDGQQWHPLGKGLSDLGEKAWMGAGGLWLSGPFTTAGEEGTYGLAHWAF